MMGIKTCPSPFRPPGRGPELRWAAHTRELALWLVLSQPLSFKAGRARRRQLPPGEDLPQLLPLQRGSIL